MYRQIAEDAGNSPPHSLKTGHREPLRAQRRHDHDIGALVKRCDVAEKACEANISATRSHLLQTLPEGAISGDCEPNVRERARGFEKQMNALVALQSAQA